MRADVMVAGGGPAGSAVAIRLARAGVRVVLAERQREAHHKVCGEFLSGEAIEDLAELGLDPQGLGAVPITEIALASAGGDPVVRRLPFPAASLSRMVLDEAMLSMAEAAGATVLRGATVKAVETGTGGATARIDGAGTVQATALFAATGKHDLRGHTRPDGAQGDLIGLKMLFRGTPAARDAPVTLVPFRGGYAGLQPVGDDAVNLCLLVSRQRFAAHGSTFATLLEALVLEAPEIARQVGGAEALLPRALAIARIPYGYVRRHTDGPWWLGDQAAVIPSFAGDGIAIALESARQAAAIWLSGGTAARFQADFARTVAGPVARATALSRLLVRPWFQRPAGGLARVPGVIDAVALGTRVRLPRRISSSRRPP